MIRAVIVLLFLNCIIGYGQERIDSSALFDDILANPATELDSRTYSENVVKELYELDAGRNQWTAFKEFYSTGELYEKGIFLNGEYFSVWKTFDKAGNIESVIDYSAAKRLRGPAFGYEELFKQCRAAAQGVIEQHFGQENRLKLNVSRSYWYSENSSGTWFEPRSEKPNELRLVYAYAESDSLRFDAVSLYFDTSSEPRLTETEGLPAQQPYNFKVDYTQALSIAQSKGFGLKNRNNVFKDSEYLNLVFNEKLSRYFWIISRVHKTEYTPVEGYPGSAVVKGFGKTLRIDSLTGQVTESKFNGVGNIN